MSDIPDKNLFMMCNGLKKSVLSSLPDGYHVRPLRKEELDIWKGMHFDDPALAQKYHGYMTKFFHDVYEEKEYLFYQKCLFVCDQYDTPIATCFAWVVYDKATTIHWFKVVKQYEGLGIGRALLSIVMSSLSEAEYPVYLHTQPSSYRAIKLYTDFGFAILTDPIIGQRQNEYEECLPILKEYMPETEYQKLQFANAPLDFLEAAASSPINQF